MKSPIYSEYFLPAGYDHENDNVNKHRAGYVTYHNKFVHELSDRELINTARYIISWAWGKYIDWINYKIDLPGRCFSYYELAEAPIRREAWFDKDYKPADWARKVTHSHSLFPWLNEEIVKRNIHENTRFNDVMKYIVEPTFYILTDAWDEYNTRQRLYITKNKV